MDDLLVIEDLVVAYSGPAGEVRAVDGVSLRLPRGASLGLVGESGCGKTTLALALVRLLPSCASILSGRILLEGEDLVQMPETAMEGVRWRRVALIPQAAMNSLNPVYTVGWQIREAIATHERVASREADRRAAAALELVGLDPARRFAYPHELSVGMRQRVVIAMAFACRPPLIVADEPGSGLDAISRAQVLGLMQRLRHRLGTSFVMISHDLEEATALGDLVAVMYAGKVVEVCPAGRFPGQARHPYSRALAAAHPPLRGPRQQLTGIPGEVPRPGSPPPGCRFHPRCPEAAAACRQVGPELSKVAPGHHVACHLWGGEGL